MAADRTRILLDTDLAMGVPGSDIDDGFALALALADPAIALELVTTVNGNADVESGSLLSGELLGWLALGTGLLLGALVLLLGLRIGGRMLDERGADLLARLQKQK